MTREERFGKEEATRKLGGLKRACIDLLFPPCCAACGTRLPVNRDAHLCPECRRGVRFLREPCCPICGTEQPGGEGSGYSCGSCLADPPSYDLARSLVRYQASVRQLIHRLKYGGATFVASALSELAQEADLAPFAECSHIVPVPLHRQRLQSRGLNQAVTLARLLFPDRLAAIRVDGLIRVRKTLAQTELRGADRRRNLRNAFRINEAFDPSGSSICLVDDVFTTGTTVAECSRILKRHGAMEVRVVTLARTGLTGGVP